MEAMKPSRPGEPDATYVYSLDRRGPNDPRFGSIHVLIGLFLIALALGMIVVL